MARKIRHWLLGEEAVSTGRIEGRFRLSRQEGEERVGGCCVRDGLGRCL